MEGEPERPIPALEEDGERDDISWFSLAVVLLLVGVAVLLFLGLFEWLDLL